MVAFSQLPVTQCSPFKSARGPHIRPHTFAIACTSNDMTDRAFTSFLRLVWDRFKRSAFGTIQREAFLGDFGPLSLVQFFLVLKPRATALGIHP